MCFTRKDWVPTEVYPVLRPRADHLGLGPKSPSNALRHGDHHAYYKSRVTPSRDSVSYRHPALSLPPSTATALSPAHVVHCLPSVDETVVPAPGLRRTVEPLSSRTRRSTGRSRTHMVDDEAVVNAHGRDPRLTRIHGGLRSSCRASSVRGRFRGLLTPCIDHTGPRAFLRGTYTP